MLKECGVDPLGVSLDSLLIFTPKENCEEIMEKIRKLGIKIEEVGFVVEKPKKAKIIVGDKIVDLKPKFRESAYTEIKKVVGEETPIDKDKLEKAVKKAFKEAIKKRNYFLKIVK